MFGRPANYMNRRSLFLQATDSVVTEFLNLNIQLQANFVNFLEYVKIIFEQKGYVATGLSASVVVARNPVTFMTKGGAV
jgi:hypothetical protein